VVWGVLKTLGSNQLGTHSTGRGGGNGAEKRPKGKISRKDLDTG